MKTAADDGGIRGQCRRFAVALRSHVRHTTTPIVVVTSEEGPAVEAQVLELGADDYILKPFEPTVLTSRIKAAFRRQRLAVSCGS